MNPGTGAEVVVTEGPATRRARSYQWLLDHLAAFPGRVTVVTFAAGVVVTVAAGLWDGDWNPTKLISLIATLWALFFAVMIYLLTARDTDKVLDQIADLHEQLATALDAPSEDAGPSDGGSADHAVDTAPDTESLAGVPRPAVRPLAPAQTDHRELQQHGARPGPRLVNGSPAIIEEVPAELITAWTSATGKNREDLARAWTRDPRSDRQWVFETSSRERWLVFSKGDRGVGVMSLDEVGRAGRHRPNPLRR
ncbi:hypothetical protein [Leifsonia poae]|uniref:hypothetical protein n=1 Tax=Leifsonia poae TaxID=110933 RepID=UPI001CBDA087|nr:hypothetical protein [Leifsonia poae]